MSPRGASPETEEVYVKKRKHIAVYCVIISIFLSFSSVYSQELKPIELLPPQTEGGKPLMQALRDRQSMQEFSPKDLPLQVVSDMLWAASGITKPDSGLKTAPTAMDMQEIDIYVTNSDGVYLYEAKNNILTPVVAGDIRALTGNQPFVKDAPINLVYVADLSKMSKMSSNDAVFYSATDTGFISQNVYLYCASAGLATVVRGWVDKSVLAEAMHLRSDQIIILAQTVGYPTD